MMDIRNIQIFIHSINARLNTINFSPKDIVFEERVKLKCFSCKHYGIKHTCPPLIPKLDYEKIISEYSNALLVWCVMEYDKTTDAEVRYKSTQLVHYALLQAEKYFWQNNNSLAISFIGGSCKLCTECAKKKCRQPSLARIPMEGIGINVIKTCKKQGLTISFPPDKQMYRVGLLLW